MPGKKSDISENPNFYCISFVSYFHKLSDYCSNWFQYISPGCRGRVGLWGNIFEGMADPQHLRVFSFCCHPGGPIVGRCKICSPFYFFSVLLPLVLSPPFLFLSFSSFSSLSSFYFLFHFFPYRLPFSFILVFDSKFWIGGTGGSLSNSIRRGLSES